MRKVPFVKGEFYHIFNRGVDKRNIFSDKHDLERFFQSMVEFNTQKPIGSIYENSFGKKDKNNSLGSLTPKLDRNMLVNLICFCLNPNHYHFVLEQITDGGIEKFMQKLGTGYTNYFNEKYKRKGSLFQGSYKGVYVESNEQLLHVSVYVNLNNKLGSLTPKLSKSSWVEYVDKVNGICKKDIILEQFKSIKEYKSFAEDSLEDIIARKENEWEV